MDVAIAGAFVAFTVAEALFAPGDAPWWRALAGGLAAALLAWRRTAPITVALLVVLVNVVTNPEAQFSTLLSLVLICFTVGYETRPPRSYLGLALVLLPFIGASVVNDFEVSDLAAALVFFVGPWTVGAVTRDRAERAEEAVARADRLEREREAEAARVAEQERTRIARELHDIVSHSISVVTIQTQAVRRRLGPEQPRKAEDLMAVEATAQRPRGDAPALRGAAHRRRVRLAGAAARTLRAGRLVEQASSGDLTAALTVQGDPVELSPGSTWRRTASPRKASPTPCATAAPATPPSRCAGARRTSTSRSRTTAAGVPAEPTNGGHGLVGIRERVALYGGTCDSSPRPAEAPDSPPPSR